MFLRTMRANFLLLTQLYSYCAFESPNLENYLHLSKFMFLRAICSRFLLLTHFSSLCIKNPLSRKVFSFKNIHTPQGNVSTHDASDSILSSVRAMCLHMVLQTQFYPYCALETPNLENYLHLSILMLLNAMC